MADELGAPATAVPQATCSAPRPAQRPPLRLAAQRV